MIEDFLFTTRILTPKELGYMRQEDNPQWRASASKAPHDKTDVWDWDRARAVEKELAAATAEKYKKDPVWQGVLARFPRALREVAKVSVYGTKKHEVPLSDMSYMDIPDGYRVYSDACARHLLDEAREGPINHDDGGQLHPAQLAWDALARLEIYLRDREKENKK